MLIEFKDYNSADTIMIEQYSEDWNYLFTILNDMPPYLKPSREKGIEGSPIFDPVGVNEHLTRYLQRGGWGKVKIGDNLKILGKHYDFGRKGIILEAQFSNYPFLLNNLIRSEILSKVHFSYQNEEIKIIIIITKGKMFPSSQSTLYYEQARGQIDLLKECDVFDIAVRLIGLFIPYNEEIPAKWTIYSKSQSRTIVDQKDTIWSIKKEEKNNF